QRSPGMALAMTFLLLSLIGIPPTAGFFGKFVLFRAAGDGGFLWLALATALHSMISIPYHYWIVRNMYLSETEKPRPLPTALGPRLALGIAVVGTFILGVFPEPLVRFLASVRVMP